MKSRQYIESTKVGQAISLNNKDAAPTFLDEALPVGLEDLNSDLFLASDSYPAKGMSTRRIEDHRLL